MKLFTLIATICVCIVTALAQEASVKSKSVSTAENTTRQSTSQTGIRDACESMSTAFCTGNEALIAANNYCKSHRRSFQALLRQSKVRGVLSPNLTKSLLAGLDDETPCADLFDKYAEGGIGARICRVVVKHRICGEYSEDSGTGVDGGTCDCKCP